MTNKWNFEVYEHKYILYETHMTTTIHNLCENLKQKKCSNNMQQQRISLDNDLDELWRL